MKFPKEITPEFFEYTTHLSLNQFKTEVTNLVDESKSSGFSTNLSGKILDDNEFYITSKWNVGPLVTGPLSYGHVNHPTNLRIFIYLNKNEKTQVNLLVTPNSYYPLLFVFLPVSFLIMLLLSHNESRTIGVYLVILALFILSPIAILMVSNFLKKKLRDNFIKHFHLQELA